MTKEYAAIISKTKTDQHSFLVAIIPAISIPSEYELNEDIFFTDLAVIAANHNLPKTNKWAYVHLERDEKQEIGRALVDACASLNTWYWCNLYEG